MVNEILQEKERTMFKKSQSGNRAPSFKILCERPNFLEGTLLLKITL
jgi:hypothetical protein